MPEQKKDIQKEEISLEITQKLLEQDPVVRAVTKILTDGVDRHASDILIEPLEEELQIRYKIDGVLYKALVLPKVLHDGVITRIKVMSNLDISEHRLPQDGRFKMSTKEKEIDFRVSVIPSILGEKIVLRVLDKSMVILDIDKLGLDSRSLELFKRNLKKPFGMILVCGPTGSGKTTTLYSALKYVDSIEKNIVTVEDPVEYQLYGINQVAVNEEIGLTFASVLRAILRQDPNIILVGEIRDFETADIAVKASLTGHLLLSTLHTTSATASVVRLINMGIEPYLLASSCLLIASQVLVRLLCPYCKEAYKPSPTVLKELNSVYLVPEEELILYRQKGCEICGNTGFKGRTIIAETMEISSDLRDLISVSAPEKEIRDIALKEGMVSLKDNGFRLVREGLTSIEEVLRVTALS